MWCIPCKQILVLHGVHHVILHGVHHESRIWRSDIARLCYRWTIGLIIKPKIMEYNGVVSLVSVQYGPCDRLVVINECPMWCGPGGGP